jgi:hypothetical protein
MLASLQGYKLQLQQLHRVASRMCNAFSPTQDPDESKQTLQLNSLAQTCRPREKAQQTLPHSLNFNQNIILLSDES